MTTLHIFVWSALLFELHGFTHKVMTSHIIHSSNEAMAFSNTGYQLGTTCNGESEEKMNSFQNMDRKSREI